MSQAFCAMRRAMPSLLRAGIRSRSALPLGRPLGPEPQLRLPVAHHCRSLSDSVSTKPSGSKDSGGDNAAVEAEPLRNSRGEVVKTWGTSVDLPEVTKKEAEDAFLDATSVTRSMKPAIQEAVAARDDMLKDRFNYVSKNLNSDAQYVVMGGKGKVAPAAVGQASFLFAGLVVLLGAIGTVVYIKTQWGVGSAKGTLCSAPRALLCSVAIGWDLNASFAAPLQLFCSSSAAHPRGYRLSPRRFTGGDATTTDSQNSVIGYASAVRRARMRSSGLPLRVSCGRSAVKRSSR